MKIKYYTDGNEIQESQIKHCADVEVRLIVDKKTVGTCSFHLTMCLDDDKDGGFVNEDSLFYINTLEVKEQYRRLGYGTILVSIIQSIANKYYSGIEKVVHCNEKSIGIFRKLGFIEKETYTILTKK